MSEYDYEQKPAEIARRIMTRKIKKLIENEKLTVYQVIQEYMNCYHINEKHRREITRLCHERLNDNT